MVSSSAFLALLAVVVSSVQASPLLPPLPHMTRSYKFSTVTGFFKYDSADGVGLPAVAANFGLRENTTWAELERTLAELNFQGRIHDGSSYKLLYAGRHGQGFHNVAQSKYGNDAWDNYWSELTTDGTLVWGPDARLTPLGIQQAHDVNDGWMKFRQQSDSPPLPSKLYSSPLSRALSTMEISYNNLLLQDPTQADSGSSGWTIGGFGGEPLHIPGILPIVPVPNAWGPTVKELFREEYGQHTCDERRTKTQLQADYPNVNFEQGFSETDQLWTTTREEDSHLDQRIQQALTQMWNESPGNHVVSLTSHSGVMQSIFRVVGHYPISPATGAFIPLIIKATPAN